MTYDVTKLAQQALTTGGTETGETETAKDAASPPPSPSAESFERPGEGAPLLSDTLGGHLPNALSHAGETGAGTEGEHGQGGKKFNMFAFRAARNKTEKEREKRWRAASEHLEQAERSAAARAKTFEQYLGQRTIHRAAEGTRDLEESLSNRQFDRDTDWYIVEGDLERDQIRADDFDRDREAHEHSIEATRRLADEEEREMSLAAIDRDEIQRDREMRGIADAEDDRRRSQRSEELAMEQERIRVEALNSRN